MKNLTDQIDVIEEEVKRESNKMETNKSPRNDGLTKEFFETFYDNVKVPGKPEIKALISSTLIFELNHKN